jgi:phospholipase C
VRERSVDGMSRRQFLAKAAAATSAGAFMSLAGPVIEKAYGAGSCSGHLSGALTIVNALRILLSNPAVWEKTALIISYDECGSYSDHVVPPTAPAGTPGEYVTVPDINAVTGSGGIRGPIGLGYRVLAWSFLRTAAAA